MLLAPNCISKQCYLTRQWASCGSLRVIISKEPAHRVFSESILFCLAPECHLRALDSEISLHCAPRASLQLTLTVLKKGETCTPRSNLQKMWIEQKSDVDPKERPRKP